MEKYRTYIIFSFSLLISVFSSCLVDKDEVLYLPEPPDELLLLHIQVPPADVPLSRALLAAEESRIATLDVLVFEKTLSGEVFAYHKPATAVDEGSENASVRTFSIPLQASTGQEEYRFVFLANVRSLIETATFLIPGAAKNSLLEQFVFNMPGTLWNISTHGHLPMWGESRNTHIVNSSLTSAAIGTISLIRSVARLDVGVNMGSNDQPQALAGRNKFEIEELQLRNISDKAAIVPAPSLFDITQGKVTAPTIPASAVPTRFSYTPSSVYGSVREIYLAETAASAGYMLLIKGRYTPQGGTAQTGWYRVNLDDESGPAGSQVNIRRNHRYRLNITDVYKAGYATADAAATSSPENQDQGIAVTLKIYEDEGDINHIGYNKDYLLGVESAVCTIPRAGKQGVTLRVLTTYSGGWSYNILDAAGNAVTWVTNRSKTTADNKEYLSFDVQAGTARRTAYIYLVAGALSISVELVQE